MSRQYYDKKGEQPSFGIREGFDDPEEYGSQDTSDSDQPLPGLKTRFFYVDTTEGKQT